MATTRNNHRGFILVCGNTSYFFSDCPSTNSQLVRMGRWKQRGNSHESSARGEEGGNDPQEGEHSRLCSGPKLSRGHRNCRSVRKGSTPTSRMEWEYECEVQMGLQGTSKLEENKTENMFSAPLHFSYSCDPCFLDRQLVRWTVQNDVHRCEKRRTWYWSVGRRSTSSSPRKRKWSQTSVGSSCIGFMDAAARGKHVRIIVQMFW